MCCYIYYTKSSLDRIGLISFFATISRKKLIVTIVSAKKHNSSVQTGPTVQYGLHSYRTNCQNAELEFERQVNTGCQVAITTK